jgi:hypothetical protein
MTSTAISPAVITSGARFIGAHLARRLPGGRGAWAACADNFCTGSRRSLDPLLGRPGFRLIEAGVTEKCR